MRNGNYAQEIHSSSYSQVKEPPAEASVNIVEDIEHSVDLLSVWNEIVAEIRKKHPLTSQSLNKTLAKIVSPSSVQITVANKFDYDGVMEFQEQISKLYQRKTGSNISVKVVIENIEIEEKSVKEDIIIEEESAPDTVEYTVKEDLKESAKTAVPSHIEAIAKKFGATAKKA